MHDQTAETGVIDSSEAIVSRSGRCFMESPHVENS
jgi:hypothetical protein